MSDGYTLAEALAAMMIIGLSAGGMALAGSLFESQQRNITRSLAEQKVQLGAQRVIDEFARRLEPAGDAKGDEIGFQGACGDGPCSLKLTSTPKDEVLTAEFKSGVEEAHLAPIGWRFRFFGPGTMSPSWPIPDQNVSLSAIGLFGQGKALAMARVWREEPGACQFDPIVARCRSAGQ